MEQQNDCYDGQAKGIVGPLFKEIDDPFWQSIHTPTTMERLVAELIWSRTRANPISITDLREETGADERTVKEIVESLITFHKVRIGAARGKPNGYFMIRSIQDQEAAVKPYRSQVRAMLRRLRVLESPEAVKEFLGQLQTEV
jgi:hypothetical protein